MRDGFLADARGTLGVVGTLVWDRIIPLNEASVPVEDWGGIAYSLVAASVALPEGWTIRPLVRVGADLEGPAQDFLAAFPAINTSEVVVVPEKNNRVELRYHSESERTETLIGGVSGWDAPELIAATVGCDALLVNFISGFEMSLEAAMALRAEFQGPIYADLHSLFLGIDDDGVRTPRTLSDGAGWAGAFDIVQMNEDEFALLGPDSVTSFTSARSGPVLTAVTLGERGVDLYGAAAVEEDLPRLLETRRSGTPGGGGGTGTEHRSRSTARGVASNVTLDGLPLGNDPTGCGDVWGSVMFSRLLAGDTIVTAATRANQIAAVSASVRGVTALRSRLSGSTT